MNPMHLFELSALVAVVAAVNILFTSNPLSKARSVTITSVVGLLASSLALAALTQTLVPFGQKFIETILLLGMILPMFYAMISFSISDGVKAGKERREMYGVRKKALEFWLAFGVLCIFFVFVLVLLP